MVLPALKSVRPTTEGKDQYPHRYRFTVEEFYRMLDAGIFTEDDRVELVEGDIVDMMPIGARHAFCVDTLTAIFVAQSRGRYIVRVQGPLRVGPTSEVLPDLMLLRPPPERYREAHPTSEDVLLVVEVAETSSAYDREVKVPLYARYGIPEHWLINLQDNVIEVYREPSQYGYKEVHYLRDEDILHPRAFTDIAIPVTELLPSTSDT